MDRKEFLRNKKASNASVATTSSRFTNLSRQISIHNTLARVPGLKYLPRFVSKLSRNSAVNATNQQNTMVNNLEKMALHELDTTQKPEEGELDEEDILFNRRESLETLILHNELPDVPALHEVGDRTLDSAAFKQLIVMNSDDSDEDDMFQQRFKDNVRQFTKATRTKSVNAHLTQKNYMEKALEVPNQKLRRAIRRSVRRTRRLRALPTPSAQMRARFRDDFGNFDPEDGESGQDKLTKNDPETSVNFDPFLEKEDIDRSSIKAAAQKAVRIKNKLQKKPIKSHRVFEEEVLEDEDNKKEIIMEGSLEKPIRGAVKPQWHYRHGVLRKTGLFYYFDKDDYDNDEAPTGEVRFMDIVRLNGYAAEALSPFQVMKLHGRPYIFQIHTERAVFIFSVKTKKNQEQWTTQINNAYKHFVVDQARRQALVDGAKSWVAKDPWGELKEALNEPEADVSEVAAAMKEELLEHLDAQLKESKNFERKQIAFEAWKVYVKIIQRKRREEEIKMITRRHSVRHSDRFLLQLPEGSDSLSIRNNVKKQSSKRNLRPNAPRRGRLDYSADNEQSSGVIMARRVSARRFSKTNVKELTQRQVLFQRSDSKGFYFPAVLPTKNLYSENLDHMVELTKNNISTNDNSANPNDEIDKFQLE